MSVHFVMYQKIYLRSYKTPMSTKQDVIPGASEGLVHPASLMIDIVMSLPKTSQESRSYDYIVHRSTNR